MVNYKNKRAIIKFIIANNATTLEFSLIHNTGFNEYSEYLDISNGFLEQSNIF